MRERPERVFYYRLAAHLGYANVDAMLRQMSSRQVSEWAAYERIAGPLGGARADIASAIVASTVANVHRAKGQPPVKPSRFIPDWDPRPQPPEQMKMIVRAMNQAFGGTEVRAGGDAG